MLNKERGRNYLYRMRVSPASLQGVDHPHSKVAHKQECDHLAPRLLVSMSAGAGKPRIEDKNIIQSIIWCKPARSIQNEDSL